MEPASPRPPETRTVLAGAEATVRGALRELVTQALGMRVVAEAETRAALERHVRLLDPDLVIVAWDLVADEAEPTLAALQSSSRERRIVVVGLRPETRRIALSAGADGFVSMVDVPETVIRALQRSQVAGAPHDSDKTRRQGHPAPLAPHDRAARLPETGRPDWTKGCTRWKT
jgi:DNA-binding NarL/FixJ family response regulator